MGGLSSPISGTENRYRYNGKELHTELNLGLYDYGFRWYDPSIARFVSVDPLASYQAMFTPYHYTYNNPIIFTDPSGLAPVYREDEDGNGKYVDNEDESKEYSWDEVLDYLEDGDAIDISVSDESSIELFFGHYSGTEDLGRPGGILVVGRDKFKNRYEEDRKELLKTPKGVALFSIVQGQGEKKGIRTVVSEASAYSIFWNWNPTPLEDLQASETVPLITEEYGGRKRFANRISLRYSQHWGVMYDGAKTRSYLTLAHELQHAADIIQGGPPTSDRMFYEKKAVAAENQIRRELRIPGERTHYHGKRIF